MKPGWSKHMSGCHLMRLLGQRDRLLCELALGGNVVMVCLLIGRLAAKSGVEAAAWVLLVAAALAAAVMGVRLHELLVIRRKIRDEEAAR